MGQSVSYSQPAGAYTSTISQADADDLGLAKFNTDGQAYADNNAAVKCVFKNTAKSGLFTRNNCAAGGTPESVLYTVAAGIYSSDNSQAEADTQAQNDVNINGYAYANANGRCRFWNTAQSGSFTRSNCAVGGVPETVVYTVPAGRYDSYSSQAAADNLARDEVNANGLVNANANGRCRFWNTAQSGSFTRSNCAVGGIPEAVVYTVPAGRYDSYSSQAAADNLARDEVNANGLANANANGKCTFKSIALNGSFTKNNCPAGGVGSSVPFSQVAGAKTSIISQADADSEGLRLFNTRGEVYANTNGSCTFNSVALSGWFTRNNCASGGVGSIVFFSQVAGAKTSTDSQADADSKGLALFNSNGQAYANDNNNAKCIFANTAKSAVFTRNNCAAGGTPESVTYSVPAGRYSSDVSQEAADIKAQNDITANGQAYANDNNNAKCIFWNSAQSRLIARNNCAAGGTPESVWYTVSAGTYNSNTSQGTADDRALDEINRYGQNYANSAGKCTFYSLEINDIYYKNNCPPGMRGSTVYYHIPYGTYKSFISEADATNKAVMDSGANGQNYANSEGYCLNPGEEEN
ncbi:DUF5977 domain-containing protein [Flavobacterium sp. N502536]|uniref:DUF5977 domain-containing protein n=1 Tax=Flavobacterium sp. N502536 TaxID=2986837 RepID=UPI0022213730|nr:DUF5977 domain-containing protein [Flavobacterium sp. N502536]